MLSGHFKCAVHSQSHPAIFPGVPPSLDARHAGRLKATLLKTSISQVGLEYRCARKMTEELFSLLTLQYTTARKKVIQHRARKV
jgi:hypothetical protein